MPKALPARPGAQAPAVTTTRAAESRPRSVTTSTPPAPGAIERRARRAGGWRRGAGPRELRGDDALGKEHAGIVLEVAAFAVGGEEGGEARADRRRVEQLVGDAEALREGDRLGQEAGLAVIPGDVGGGRADHQPAGAAIERLAARRLELGPERVRAHRQRHERRAFADREPGDAGQAMARALVVRRREAVDADHLRAAGGEVVAERAADRAEADDDHVRGGDVHAGRLSAFAPDAVEGMCRPAPSGRTTIAA